MRTGASDAGAGAVQGGKPRNTSAVLRRSTAEMFSGRTQTSASGCASAGRSPVCCACSDAGGRRPRRARDFGVPPPHLPQREPNSASGVPKGGGGPKGAPWDVDQKGGGARSRPEIANWA